MAELDNCPMCDRPAKGITLIVVMHDKDGDPEPIVMNNIQPGDTEAITVNFVTGQVSFKSKIEPKLVDSATGEEIVLPAASED